MHSTAVSLARGAATASSASGRPGGARSGQQSRHQKRRELARVNAAAGKDRAAADARVEELQTSTGKKVFAVSALASLLVSSATPSFASASTDLAVASAVAAKSQESVASGEHAHARVGQPNGCLGTVHLPCSTSTRIPPGFVCPHTCTLALVHKGLTGRLCSAAMQGQAPAQCVLRRRLPCRPCRR